MTPKEKAKELFNKYSTYVVMWAGDVKTSHENCKQFALITVDEIEKHTSNAGWPPTNHYWESVRQEIHKM